VAFVNHHKEIMRKVIHQRMRRAACRALVENMMVVARADGIIHPEEDLRMRRELFRLPCAWDHDEAYIAALVARAREEAAGIAVDLERVAGKARDLAELLPARAREVAYRMLTGVAASDGLADREADVLAIYRRELGLTFERAAVILTGINDELAGSLL
jgi:tellurite resistance protein